MQDNTIVKEKGKGVALEITNVSKAFGKNQVLQSLDLDVRDHEFLVLLGPSGCGKTTLLRIIGGLIEPESGKVVLGGRDITRLPAHKRDIGFVFQHYALFPHMTVAKNVAFGLRMRGVPKTEIDRKIHEALQIVRLEGLERRKITQLSGGQQQRVALARALVLQPSLLLLDEPLSNLDAKLRAAVRVEIAQIQKQLGVTTIFVTHDQVEAMTMGDRIVLLKDGIVQQAGTPLEIYDRPVNTFVAEFVGSPSINFFPMEVADGRAILTDVGLELATETVVRCLQTETAESALPPCRYVLGVRPEDILVLEGDETKDAMFKAVVTFVEHLGSDTLLHLQLVQRLLIGRLPGNVMGIQPGQEVGLAIRPGRAHLFSAESGARAD
jgi:ABC-type sugar transport system ATPase subunit